MARFRNTLTGVVVDVDDDTASGLGVAYSPEGDAKPSRSPAPRKRTSKSSDDD